MRIAVVDMGTNTFNLIIANCTNDNYEFLYESKYHTYVGKGNSEGFIDNAAIKRIKKSFDEISLICKKFDVEKRIGMATAVFRSAANASNLISEINETYDFEIDIIDGHREAELVYKAVNRSIDGDLSNFVIIDIGGGSIEMSIGNRDHLLWTKSIGFGGLHLLNNFVHSTPVNSSEIENIETYLKPQIKEAVELCELHHVKAIVGVSGAFDTYRDMLTYDSQINFDKNKPSFEIRLRHFFKINHLFIKSSLEEQKKLPGVDQARVELMMVAGIFINLFIKETHINKIIQSKYSLREGALFELNEVNINTTND
ncbi:MAG: hypothetical protein N4A49_13260 [Marinifilaceae bacterium]|nr:hypothetical protein [Marinifilaceae bacterium]